MHKRQICQQLNATKMGRWSGGLVLVFAFFLSTNAQIQPYGGPGPYSPSARGNEPAFGPFPEGPAIEPLPFVQPGAVPFQPLNPISEPVPLAGLGPAEVPYPQPTNPAYGPVPLGGQGLGPTGVPIPLGGPGSVVGPEPYNPTVQPVPLRGLGPAQVSSPFGPALQPITGQQPTFSPYPNEVGPSYPPQSTPAQSPSIISWLHNLLNGNNQYGNTGNDCDCFYEEDSCPAGYYYGGQCADGIQCCEQL